MLSSTRRGAAETSSSGNRKLGILKLSHVLTAGAVFPFDFGFGPSTHGADGDALDMLVFRMSNCFRSVWFRRGSSG